MDIGIVSFIAGITVRSPLQLFVFIIYENNFWIKASTEYLIWFWKRKHWTLDPPCRVGLLRWFLLVWFRPPSLACCLSVLQLSRPCFAYFFVTVFSPALLLVDWCSCAVWFRRFLSWPLIDRKLWWMAGCSSWDGSTFRWLAWSYVWLWLCLFLVLCLPLPYHITETHTLIRW